MSLENKIFETHWSMWFIIYTHSHSLQFNTRCLYAVIISLSTQLNILYGHRNYHFLGWKQQIWRSGGDGISRPVQPQTRCTLLLQLLEAGIPSISPGHHMLGDHSANWAASLTECILTEKLKPSSANWYWLEMPWVESLQAHCICVVREGNCLIIVLARLHF